ARERQGKINEPLPKLTSHLQARMPESLKLEQIGAALIVRLARPEIRNPLSAEVLDQLHRIVDHLAGQSEIQKLVLTGTDDVFASGADLREIAQLDAETAREFGARGQSLMAKIAALPLRTIAAINGYCFGGALDLALACETRIATSNAVFSHPGV